MDFRSCSLMDRDGREFSAPEQKEGDKCYVQAGRDKWSICATPMIQRNRSPCPVDEHSHDSGCYVLACRTGLSSPLFNEDDNWTGSFSPLRKTASGSMNLARFSPFPEQAGRQAKASKEPGSSDRLSTSVWPDGGNRFDRNAGPPPHSNRR